jgi:uncharacterized protein YegJ (DUF2314 family)
MEMGMLRFSRAMVSFGAALAILLAAPNLPADEEKIGKAVPPGDVRSAFAFYSVVFYYAPSPKGDTAGTVKSLASKYFPDLPITTSPSQEPPFLAYEEEPAPLTNYPVPDAGYFKFAGRGLSAEDVSNVQRTARATFVLLAVPKDQVWSEGRKFTEFALEFAEKTGAVIWDSATRECFSQKAWKEARLDSWPEGGVPELRDQITIHLYRPDDSSTHVRAITLGMEKFALPDLVIERLVGGDSRSGGNLINVVAQTLAEKSRLDSGTKEIFRLEDLKSKNFREAMVGSLEKEATGEIPLMLVYGNPVEGDPDNTLFEIRFDHGAGKTVDERRDDLLSEFWGATDAAKEIVHTAEILEASKRARAKLLEIKKHFDKGLAPGERLLVKAPFPRDDGGNEWMWVEVMKWPSSAVIEGVLQNDPFFIEKLKAGAPVKLKLNEVFDYILYRPDGTSEGNETGRLMEKQAGKEISN